MLGDLAIALGNRLGRNGRAVRILRPAYSAWLNAAYGRRGISWWVNGERLRIHPAVRHLIPQDNERPLFDYLRAAIRPGDVRHAAVAASVGRRMLEFEVLQGAQEAIRAARGRMKIVVETHPDQWPEFGIDPDEAQDRFHMLGLRARPLMPADPLFIQGGHVILEPLS